MKYPNKRVMYLAPEIPALSATFVYNEIFQFEKQICPVDIVSVHRPHSPAGNEVVQKFSSEIYYLYEQSYRSCILATVRMLVRRPVNFLGAFLSLTGDLISLGLVSRNAFGALYRFFYSTLLAQEMLNRNIHHLHTHFAHVPGDLAMYASMMAGIPFSITGHANDIYQRGWLLKQKVRRSAFFATISEFNRVQLAGKGCDRKKIEILRCGIDQGEFQYRGDQWPSAAALRIGSLGRLVPKKGFHTLLEACAKLRDKSVQFNLEIAGDGPLADELKAMVDSLDLADEVQFMGAMPHSRVSEWMRSLDVFVLACCQDESGDVDGIPVVLMEAMAIGVPVVTTKISGLPELAIDRETGLLSEPEDATQIANLLSEISSDKALRSRLVAGAKFHVDKEFTLQANVEKLGELIFSSQGNKV